MKSQFYFDRHAFGSYRSYSDAVSALASNDCSLDGEYSVEPFVNDCMGGKVYFCLMPVFEQDYCI